MAGAGANPVSFLLDKDGLITTERKGVDPAAAPFAKAPWRLRLASWVKKVKPHVLLGLSGVGGVFNEQVLKAMRESDSPKPAIFAMSNLTVNGNGKVGHVNQANNMYLFPGIGMGSSSLSLASFITDEEIQSGILYPPTRSI
ncbi:hypothetical protein LOK49_LG02G01049 [Camellia lanceoleosa]|uniref:Uncharacterized protein n=1 Tax=Camellia lanceoleosa TaxID=1840588 RepID=A0ACC0ILX6_9ERIC|nr:hypothetical protein LOK49_LG02G01049 [Camellia lanceoleosa]